VFIYHTSIEEAALVADSSSSAVYKLCLLVHSAVVGTAPDYVRDMLHPASERMSQSALRSATNNEILVPRSRLKFGERAFSIAAAKAWNSFPDDLRATVNTGTFEKKLKDVFILQLSYTIPC